MNCKPHGKMANATLVNYIQEKLNLHWSPEQISGRIEFKSNGKKISFSSIYNWIYKGLLDKNSVELLRRKGKSRKPKEKRRRIKKRKSKYINERNRTK